MTEVQSTLLGMLREIDSICKKHQITYYLIGGSALGAVRHNGFIPWDDDVDIVMTRENWVKFDSIIDMEIQPNRKLLTWQRTPGYPAVFARYTNTDTTCIVNSLAYSPISWGLMIDIFILTPIPNQESKREKFHQLMRDYGEIVNSFFPISLASSYTRYRFFEYMIMVFGKKRVLEKICKLIYSYPEKDCSHYSYSYSRIHVVYEKSIFQEPKYYPFEGDLFPVPTKVEEHFKILFGDTWMLLPDKQISEHSMTVDLKRSFENYTSAYMSLINTDKLKKSYQMWKRWRLSVIQANNVRKKIEKEFEFHKVELEFEIYYKNLEKDILILLDQKKYKELDDMLVIFYDKLLNKDYIQDNLIIPLLDIQIYIFVFMFNYRGEYYNAEKIILLYCNNSRAISTDIGIFINLIKWKREVEQLPDNELNIESITYWLKLFPHDYTLLLLKTKLLSCKLHMNPEEFKSHLEVALNFFPEDLIFLKYYADYLYYKGNNDEALMIYRQVKPKLKNGLILLQIEKIIDKDYTNHE